MSIRTPVVRLFYAGTEFLGDASGGLVSFCFTDQAYDQADSVEATIENRSQVWNNAWMPKIGGVMTAIVQYQGDGMSVPLICGVFSVDDIRCSGPPDIVQIRGVSASVDTALRNQKNSRGYEETSLKKIAGDIAQKHGFQLYWDADDVELKRQDQRQQSDLAFLRDLCARYGVKVKVGDGKIICRGIKQMDIQPPTMVISRGSSDILHYALGRQSHNIFKSAEVAYTDPEDRKTKKYKFEPPVSEAITARGMNGSELKVNERVETEDQARKRAEGELRERNKDMGEGSISLMGNTLIYAGTTILLTGFGLSFDGLWLLREARHSVNSSSGYTTDISIRKTLGW